MNGLLKKVLIIGGSATIATVVATLLDKDKNDEEVEYEVVEEELIEEEEEA